MLAVRVAAIVMLATVALAQNGPGDSAPRNRASVAHRRQMAQEQSQVSVPATAETNPGIAADTPVVTLVGVCDHSRKSAKAAPCKTIIRRAEMDALVDSLIPHASPEVRTEFTINYVRMLAAAELAQRRRLDQDPAVASEIAAREKMVRIQALAGNLYRTFEEQASSVPEAQILSYYAAHAGNFEQGEILRVSIPEMANTASGPLDPSVLKAKAADLRARAAAGEDFEKLQQQAYKDLDIRAVAPTTRLPQVGRTSLPPEQAKVFELQPGATTDVIESRGSLVVLKLVSKTLIPVKDVRQRIAAVLQQERLQDELRLASNDVRADFNLAYLQATTAPELFPAPGTANPRMANAQHRNWSTPRHPGMVMASPSR